MKQIYHSENLEMLFDDSQSYLHLIFVDEDQNMTKDTFKKEMEAYRDAVLEHQVRYVLSDSRRSHFIMTPDIQDWIAKEIFPHTVKFLRNIAFVMPWNLIQKIAMEQMIEEYTVKDTGRVMTSRYFENIDNAKSWLTEASIQN